MSCVWNALVMREFVSHVLHMYHELSHDWNRHVMSCVWNALVMREFVSHVLHMNHELSHDRNRHVMSCVWNASCHTWLRIPCASLFQERYTTHRPLGHERVREPRPAHEPINLLICTCIHVYKYIFLFRTMTRVTIALGGGDSEMQYQTSRSCKQRQNPEVPKLRKTCDVTRWYVWHDSFIRATWLIDMCDMTHWYVWHDSLICVTWLIHMWHTSAKSRGTEVEVREKLRSETNWGERHVELKRRNELREKLRWERSWGEREVEVRDKLRWETCWVEETNWVKREVELRDRFGDKSSCEAS